MILKDEESRRRCICTIQLRSRRVIKANHEAIAGLSQGFRRAFARLSRLLKGSTQGPRDSTQPRMPSAQLLPPSQMQSQEPHAPSKSESIPLKLKGHLTSERQI